MSKETNTRKLQQAVARLDEQLAARPDDPRLLELRAKGSERLEAWEEASNFWQRLVKASRAANDRPGEARACLAAGIALSKAGQPNKGSGFFQRAVAAFELLRDELSTARARLEQARHLISLGDDVRARPLLELATPGLESHEAWEEAAWSWTELSRMQVAAGGAEAGLDAARRAVEATAKAKDGVALGDRLCHLAMLHHAGGNGAKARHYLEKALPYLRQVRGSPRLLTAYDTLVAIARAEGDTDSEERWLTEAVLAFDTTRNEAAQGRLRVELSRLVARRSEARARFLVECAIERLHRGGDPRGAASAYTELGKLLTEQDREAARRAFARAIDFFRMVGDDAGVDEASALSAAAEA